MKEKKKVLWEDEKIEYLVKWKMERLKEIEIRLENEAKYEHGLLELIHSFTGGLVQPPVEDLQQEAYSNILKSTFENLDKVKSLEKYKNPPTEVDEWDVGNLNALNSLFYKKDPKTKKNMPRYDWDKFDTSMLSEESQKDFAELTACVKVLGTLSEGMENDPDFARHEVIDDVLTKTVKSLKRCLEINKENKKFKNSKLGTELKALEKNADSIIKSNEIKKEIDSVVFDEKDEEVQAERISTLCDREYDNSKKCLTDIFDATKELNTADFAHIPGAETFFAVTKKLQDKLEMKEGPYTDKDKAVFFEAMAMINGVDDDFNKYFAKKDYLDEKEIKLRDAHKAAKKFVDYGFLNFAAVEKRADERRKTISHKRERISLSNLEEEDSDTKRERLKSVSVGKTKNVHKETKKVNQKETEKKPPEPEVLVLKKKN